MTAVTSSARKRSEEEEREYWCDRGTKAQDRIRRAEKSTRDALVTETWTRNTYGSKHAGSQAVASTTIEANKAVDEYRAAQDDWERLQEEAQRRSIPPGWLYCNF